MVFDTAAGELAAGRFARTIASGSRRGSPRRFRGRLGYYAKGRTRILQAIGDPASPWAGAGPRLALGSRGDAAATPSGTASCRATSIPALAAAPGRASTARSMGSSRRCGTAAADARRGWICGLGHGVLPGTPEASVQTFVSIIGSGELRMTTCTSAICSRKYDVPVPRYTSYPTVPEWHATPTTDEWIASLAARARRAGRARCRSTCICRSASRSARSAAATRSSRAITAERSRMSICVLRELDAYLARVPALARRPVVPGASGRRHADVSAAGPARRARRRPFRRACTRGRRRSTDRSRRIRA